MLRALGSTGKEIPILGPQGPLLWCALPCGSQYDNKLLDTSPHKWRLPVALLLNTGLHNPLLTHTWRWHRHHMTSEAWSPKGTGLLPASHSLPETLGMGALSRHVSGPAIRKPQ